MGVPAWRYLIEFPDGGSRRMTLFIGPGELAEGGAVELPDGAMWIVERRSLRDLPEDVDCRVLVRPMDAYPVLLVRHGRNAIEDFFVYRGAGLPQHGQEITVESTLDSADRPRARVTRVVPENDFPVRASELES